MKRTWTIIGVGDVPGSFKWYQALFGQPAALPRGVALILDIALKLREQPSVAGGVLIL